MSPDVQQMRNRTFETSRLHLGRVIGVLGNGCSPSVHVFTRLSPSPSYLEDAVMNLDHGDPVTRDHMSTVLSQVRQKLFQFLQQDPHSALGKRARRLMMMLQGLVNH